MLPGMTDPDRVLAKQGRAGQAAFWFEGREETIACSMSESAWPVPCC